MTDPFLVVGAPVHQRAWVLVDWLHHLTRAIEHHPDPQDFDWEDVVLLFNYGPSTDGTLEILREAERMHPWTVEVMVDEKDEHVADRRWSYARYEVMARLRNDLLTRVRTLSPAYYFSLDTDILLPDGAIHDLLVDFEDPKFDAVAPTVYMTPNGKGFPNAMRLDSGARQRNQHAFTMIVEVAFAAVMMRPALYQGVDYAAHMRGEDIGWGLNARKQGMVMGLNPNVVCKHIMRPEMLDAVDPRVGW